MSTAAAQFTARQAQAQGELSEAAAARETLERRLAEAVEQMSRREMELTTLLAESTTTCDGLERRLIDAEAARRQADDRTAREHSAAERLQAELELRLGQEVANCKSLERGRLTAEAEVERLTAAHTEVQRQLDEVRTAAQETLECISNEYSYAIANCDASI